jgi:hypothetical protein
MGGGGCRNSCTHTEEGGGWMTHSPFTSCHLAIDRNVIAISKRSCHCNCHYSCNHHYSSNHHYSWKHRYPCNCGYFAISRRQENQGPTVQQSFFKEVVLNYFYPRIHTDCLWPCYVKFFNLPTTFSLTAGSL